ncbi:hypothetical protein [Sediminimonas qiaohouensis]|uniref:hypothetical protein n=1 Tax=Sediminimonas qiaohouensis TaxID=552061 RepID=UPI00047EDAB0|nr:hypothetical protein [Sediminimonas qiaohouensis]
MTSPRNPARLTRAAHEAFLALGYEIENTGADTYGHQFCDGHHSRHEALQACARIEGALGSWRSSQGINEIIDEGRRKPPFFICN